MEMLLHSLNKNDNYITLSIPNISPSDRKARDLDQVLRSTIHLKAFSKIFCFQIYYVQILSQ